MYFEAIASTCCFTSRSKAFWCSGFLAVVARGDEPLEVVERELRVHRDELVHPDHRVHTLAGPERVLEVIGVRRQRVAEEVAEQDLADAPAGLRRAQRLLEAGRESFARESICAAAPSSLPSRSTRSVAALPRGLLRSSRPSSPSSRRSTPRLELGEAPAPSSR